MKAVMTVLKEQIENFYLVRRLSLYEIKSANKNNYLGMLWEILNPGIQIAIYWYIFGVAIRGGREVDGVPFFQWMLAGILVWFFANPAIIEGSKSIYTRVKIISKMNFPISVIPSYVIFSKLYPHIMLLGITIVLFQFMGQPINIYYLQLPYFLVATVIFLVALSLITSTLATIARDIQMVVQSVVRMLLYLTPILWASRALPDYAMEIMKLNPLYYLVNGYRAALLGQGWYIFEGNLFLYFWGFTLITIFVGSAIHVKFRRHFVDFL
jgi:teichoic acid transport system permease protein